MHNDVKLLVRMPSEQKRRLAEVARYKSIGMSSFVRQVLADAIRDAEREMGRTMAKTIPDPVSELGRILSGDALEALKDLMVDPTADLQPGELARIGAAMSQIGADLTAEAKAAVAPMVEGGVGKDGYYADAGAVFKWRKGGEQTRVDTTAVRNFYPQGKHPHLYKAVVSRPSISVEL